MSFFTGSYNFESSENLHEYLQGLGVGVVLRKVLGVSEPRLEITHFPETDEWLIVLESSFRTQTRRFKVGESFEDMTFDSRPCVSTGTIFDEKILLNQSCDEGCNVVMQFEKLPENKVKMTMTGDKHLSMCYVFIKADQTFPEEGELSHEANAMENFGEERN